MNAERLLAHYERIADAPDAIARLRRFVLDLAVRGKLVPQDPNDEPASELLKRIAAEKGRLVKAGEFHEPRSFVHIDRRDLPFVPATHWGWIRLIDIARPSYGFAFSSGRFNSAKRGMPLIRIRDISKVDTEAYFDGEYDPAYVVKAGDYLVGMDGDFNLRRWKGKDGLLNQRVMRINGWRCGVDPEFVKLPLQFVLDHLHGETSLTTVKHLSAKQVNGIEIPLPPLAEQRRIVAKVDELMALCDRLEAARRTREAVRDELTAASLARLNAPDPQTFRDDARFALDNLPALTARADQIKQLRQTIIGLAAVGKLSPNGSASRQASIELDAVKKNKAQLELRKSKKIAPISFDEYWCELPSGWEWARWDQITDWITYGFTRPMPHTKDGVPIVTGKNVNQGKIIFETSDRTPIGSYQELNDKDRPKRGDILITKDGSIGRTAIVDTDEPFCINQSVAVLWLRSCHFERRFLQLALDCPQTQKALLARTEGVAIKHISVIDLGKMVLPVPPLAEQRRIVTKVDALMALCDRLEASLATADDTRRRLLEALLAETLAPADARELEAAE